MVLLIVTVFSVAVAAAAGAFALRAHRREAARADARVAALAAAIDGDALAEAGGWIAVDDFEAQSAPRVVDDHRASADWPECDVLDGHGRVGHRPAADTGAHAGRGGRVSS